METRKRKALADITSGDNLIATSLLRKLVASSANSNSISKPPFPILRSISSSTNQQFCSGSENRSDARSDTSIGSSNISSARNSRAIRFQTSSISLAEISGKRIQADAVIFSPTPVEKRKVKGESIAVTLGSPRPTKVKDPKNAMSNPSSYLEKTKQKGKVIHDLLGEPAQNVKNFGKGILSLSSCSYEKLERGKVKMIYADSWVGKTEVMEKGSGKYSTRRSFEKTITRKKETLEFAGFSVDESRELGKEIIDSRSIVERTKEKGKALITFGSSHEETREKIKAILLPFDDTVNCPPPRNKREKEKPDAGTSSCPPRLGTKNIFYEYDPDGGGNTDVVKSWTGPLAVTRKKRCPKATSSRELPLDYIQQQRAYFEEVDSFELPEEEVSEHELD